MTRKDAVLFAGLFTVIALLLANLLRPTPLQAFEPTQSGAEGSTPIAISGNGESAWALVGNKVYFISMRNRSELPAGQRNINVIDSKNLE